MDYNSTFGSPDIDFIVGDMRPRELMIAIFEDNFVEGDESFFVAVSSQNDRVMITGSPAAVTIEDNDGMSTYNT